MTAPTKMISCFECTKVGEGEAAFDECSFCGSDNTELVLVTDCPAGAGRSYGHAQVAVNCPDDNHDWGMGKHVVSVSR